MQALPSRDMLIPWKRQALCRQKKTPIRDSIKLTSGISVQNSQNSCRLRLNNISSSIFGGCSIPCQTFLEQGNHAASWLWSSKEIIPPPHISEVCSQMLSLGDGNIENHVRPQRSISSPLHHLCSICKGHCQGGVTPISGSPWKGHLHFCLSSGLDYSNSLLTAMHNRLLHNSSRHSLLLWFLWEKDDLNILCWL